MISMLIRRCKHMLRYWLCIHELPQEYWMKRTPREIASADGTPLIIDSATHNLFGHYARVLVFVDLSKKIFNEILVKREGFSFPIEVSLEWLPEFCYHCNNISHNITSCRRLHPVQNVEKVVVDKGKNWNMLKNQLPKHGKPRIILWGLAHQMFFNQKKITPLLL